jgi:hypothetical protein
MFPNPQDALPLPPRPNLEQYKKRAKDLLRAFQSPDPDALRTWAANWIEKILVIPSEVAAPQSGAVTQSRDLLSSLPNPAIDQLENFARQKLTDTPTLTAAQFVIARAQGFESWPKLAQHLEAVASANSQVNSFELAADAIVAGDTATLQRLLREHPDLPRAHSTRRHQAVLLHYVSANGIEGYRQKTPRNIVQIAELLLTSGGDVNAIADIYGGSTTLALVATSLPPERAGVQGALMHLLLDHGATIDTANSPPGPLITVCLANGRVRASEFLAQHGATLDLEGAAGLGRLDLVQNFFNDSGVLQASATTAQMERGFLWACEYGRNDVVDFLLDRGVAIQSQANTGQTALHWAVIGGHLDTITLLLDRGASLEAKNTYGGTALGQALWSAAHGDSTIDYDRIVEFLKHRGAN